MFVLRNATFTGFVFGAIRMSIVACGCKCQVERALQPGILGTRGLRRMRT